MRLLYTTFTVLGLGVATAAAESQLIYGLNFDTTAAGGDRVLATNAADATKDTLPNIGSSGGNLNYIPNPVLPGKVMSDGKGGTYNITAEQSAAGGLTLTNGFTYAMNYTTLTSAADWQIFAAVAIGNTEYSANFTGGNGFGMRFIEKGLSSGHSGITGLADYGTAIARETLTTLFITGISDGTNTTLTYTLYNIGGDLLVSNSVTFATDADMSLAFRGNGFDSSNDKNTGGIGVSNVGIYSGILTDEEMSQYVTGTVAGSNTSDFQSFGVVPEPSTATLSILALTGLLARRRRRVA